MRSVIASVLKPRPVADPEKPACATRDRAKKRRATRCRPRCNPRRPSWLFEQRPEPRASAAADRDSGRTRAALSVIRLKITRDRHHDGGGMAAHQSSALSCSAGSSALNGGSRAFLVYAISSARWHCARGPVVVPPCARWRGGTSTWSTSALGGRGQRMSPTGARRSRSRAPSAGAPSCRPRRGKSQKPVTFR
jgi:hypothetical protein